MKFCLTVVLAFAAGLAAAAPPDEAGRTWTDSTGNFSFKGTLLAYDEETVILKRDKNDLVAIPLDKLSKKDQTYLESKEAKAELSAAEGEQQTWTMRSGLKVVGRVVDYARRDVTIQRRRGKVYVNDRLYDNLPDVYQIMVPKIVGHFEKAEIEGKKELDAWLLKQKGQPATFTCEGVLLEVESGDEYGVPFFFFAEDDLKVLEPGWKTWVAKQDEEDDRDQLARDQEQQRLMLKSQAEAYQRDRQNDQQVAMMQLGLLAVGAGVTDLWEVRLFPGPQAYGPPVSVVVPADNSRIATQQALARYPGYVSGPARRVNRY
ncbi:MAG: SHD1 domain-containing protein [Pirellulales bacterium]